MNQIRVRANFRNNHCSSGFFKKKKERKLVIELRGKMWIVKMILQFPIIPFQTRPPIISYRCNPERAHRTISESSSENCFSLSEISIRSPKVTHINDKMKEVIYILTCIKQYYKLVHVFPHCWNGNFHCEYHQTNQPAGVSKNKTPEFFFVISWIVWFFLCFSRGKVGNWENLTVSENATYGSPVSSGKSVNEANNFNRK